MMDTETAAVGGVRERSAGYRQPKPKENPLTPPVFRATLREYKPADHEKLVALYAGFEPKGAYQGLPPHSEALVRKWLDGLAESGSIFFVIEMEDCLVGHAMLCPSDKNSAELAIFLHQDFRKKGLGKKLLLGTLNFACKRLELSKVWLSVQGANVPALRLFQAAGFEPSSRGDPLLWEIDMRRALSCKPCMADGCEIFGSAFPLNHEFATC